MKRSELKIGEDYYADGTNDWNAPSYGDSPLRARVVDLRPHERNRYGRRGEPLWVPTYSGKGSGVLVDLLDPNKPEEGPKDRRVVPLGHLRGPWEATRAEVLAYIKQRDEATDRREEARGQRRTLAQALEEAKGRGLFARYPYLNDGNGRYGEALEVRVHLEEFVAIIAALPAGWNYQPPGAGQ